MAKQRASQQKREREAAKRDREFKKRQKAAKRAERRENNTSGGNEVVTPDMLSTDEPADNTSTTDPPTA